MSNLLSKIKRGNSDIPPRILLAAPEKLGKSTLGSKAPNPLFICSEDGLTGLEHVARFTPESLDDLNALLNEFIAKGCEYKWLVFDTTDWLERLIHVSICKRDGKSNIEDYGYGKGHTVAEGELAAILKKLDELRQKRLVGILMLSHVHVRTHNDPRGESWDRYEMKGGKKFTGILREWVDANLFGAYEVFKTKKDGKEKTIGGDRKIYTELSPAWDAGNRLNLPAEINMEWDDLERAITENSIGSLRSKVRGLYATAKIPEAQKKAWETSVSNLDSLTADRLKVAIEKLSSIQ